MVFFYSSQALEFFCCLLSRENVFCKVITDFCLSSPDAVSALYVRCRSSWWSPLKRASSVDFSRLWRRCIRWHQRQQLQRLVCEPRYQGSQSFSWYEGFSASPAPLFLGFLRHLAKVEVVTVFVILEFYPAAAAPRKMKVFFLLDISIYLSLTEWRSPAVDLPSLLCFKVPQGPFRRVQGYPGGCTPENDLKNIRCLLVSGGAYVRWLTLSILLGRGSQGAPRRGVPSFS